MKRWMKFSLFAAALTFLLLLSTMLLVPWQVKKQGISWIEKETDRSLDIEKVTFNPFTLTLEITGLNLSEPQSDSAFVTFDRLRISVSSRSLIDWALIFDRVELARPVVRLEQLAKQEFNFSDFTRLGEEPPAEPKQEPEKPFHFSFNNIVISSGSIDFTDQTSVRQSTHTVRELNLQVPFVGNIPYLTDEYVEPFLSLNLNGSDILAEGQLKPFHESIETSLTLLLDQVDLAFYAYHFPLPLPIEITSGEIDAELDLAYRVSSTEQPKLLIGGELALTDLEVRHQDDSPLFRLPTMILDLDWAEVFQQDINLFSLDLYQPELYLSRDQSGVWSFQRLLPEQSEEVVAQSEHQPVEKALLLRAEHAALVDGIIHYQDDYPPGGFREQLRGINLQLVNFSTHHNDTTGLAFNLHSARDMTLAINGPFTLQPVTADLRLTLDGFLLEPHYPYLADLLTKPVRGRVTLASNVVLTADGNLLLEEAGLDLLGLAVPFGDDDQFTLETFSVRGGRFDLDKRQAEVAAVTLKDGQLAATRRANGSLTPLDLLREQEKEPDAATTPQPEAEAAKGQEFRFRLASFDIDNLNLKFTDASMPRHPHASIEQLDLSLENLSYPVSEQSPFTLRGNIGREGSFSFNGTVAHTPLSLQSESAINAFPLADFNDFLPADIAVSLKEGKVYSALAIELRQEQDRLTGSFAGRVSIEELSLRDPLTGGEMLAWKGLGLEGIRGQLSPFALQIKEVALSQYLANILIDQAGKINLTSVTAEQSEATTTDQEIDKPAGAMDEAEKSDPPPDIRIDALTLQGGTVSFTDRHLPNTFSTTMYELGGRVTGMASDDTMQADVDLRGQLENHSPLSISGKINPLSRDLFTDLTIRFEDIDLAPLTPYSGTYLGYAIDKGKLYLDLNYHIEHQKIDADNRILIDQFTFGEEIESEQATSLPVGLAIALLKDQNGEIHLDVPISGDLNDPSFSVAGTIFTVLKNLLVKAATSPFSLLASMLGGAEDFTSVAFAEGLSRISEEDQQSLSKLAEMLSKRPALTLEISAFVDKDRDPEGYRLEQLRQMLIATKRQEMESSGQPLPPPEEVEIGAEEYPEMLTTVYKNAEFPRPRNFIGMLQKLPVEEMEKLLLANIIVGDEQLAELAKQRAQKVRDFLVAENESIKPQIFLKPTDIYQAPKEGAAGRAEFSIASK
ncbi:MAG: DUF748 domain-containing protein [Desulfuromonadales bacterium]|nr:DUF748 domain-containing protein [Desulfuromonadales bacterium]